MKKAFAAVIELFTPSQPRRAVAIAWLSIAGVAALVVGLFDPAASSLFPPCPTRAITGFQCAGCGSTRAAHALLHGEIAAAWRLNPLLAAYAPVLGYGLFSTIVLAVAGRPLRSARLRPGFIWALLLIAVAVTILRNTAFWPYP